MSRNQQSQSNYDRAPFLKATDLPKKGPMKLKVLGVREAVNSQWSDWFLDLAAGKQKWTLGLKTDSGNFGPLFRATEKAYNRGKKEQAFVGLALKAIKAEFRGNDYVKLEVA